jgi:hypothetical protein
MVFIPAEFVCALSGRIMRNPVEALALDDEYTVENTVYEIAKRGDTITDTKWDNFNFKRTRSILVNKLSSQIKTWLAVNGFREEHADWKADLALRLKVYGEFQQYVQPTESFENLQRIETDLKQMAESCFCLGLEQDYQQSKFNERINQINRALKLGFKLGVLRDDPARKSRWPRVFLEKMVLPRRENSLSYWDHAYNHWGGP